MAPKILFYVQHLLGIGHLVRCQRVASALAEAGFHVTVASGGVPVAGLAMPGVDLLQLPPVRASTGFSGLEHPDGRPFDAADKAARRDLLLARFATLRPDILVTEAFPFGRRAMRFELLPLLEAAAAAPWKPLVAASLRDILQENRKPGRDEETAALVETFYHLLLVHGDPALARLDETFALAGRFGSRIAYTGLVAPGPVAAATPAHAVVVSAGGGAVGGALLRASLAARPLGPLADKPWLAVCGPHLPAAERQALAASAGPGVTLAAFLPDLPAHLAGATLSVSQAGYNTVADLLVAGCRSVLVPFAAGGETEQGARAARLAARGLCTVLPEEAISPQAVAGAMAAALALPSRPHGLRLDGAQASAAILAERLSARRSA